MKVLNLYAGIGGNRKLWEGVDVTAVELNPEVAELYSQFFPDDTVVITDAHEYLRQHYDDGWDFIWSSVPCQTHTNISRMAWASDAPQNVDREPQYPDMRLYQEVIFLRHFADCKWAVENVSPYYKPLIEPQHVGRHCFWANYSIPSFDAPRENIWEEGSYRKKQEAIGFDLSDVTVKSVRKDQLLNNCVNPELGLHVLKAAKVRQAKLADGGFTSLVEGRGSE